MLPAMAAVPSTLSFVLKVQRTFKSLGKLLAETPVCWALPRKRDQSLLTTLESSGRLCPVSKARPRVSVKKLYRNTGDLLEARGPPCTTGATLPGRPAGG